MSAIDDNHLELTEPNKPSRKKPMFPVQESLRAYLKHHGREVKLPVSYKDLLHFTYSVPLLDKNGRDTHWKRSSTICANLNSSAKDW